MGGTEKINEHETFTLKVESIVYEVLKSRELTVREKDNIENAIRDTLELLISRQYQECREDREVERDRMLNRLYKIIAIVAIILGIVSPALTFLILQYSL